MYAGTVATCACACIALLSNIVLANSQDSSVFVDVSEDHETETDNIEKRTVPQLARELKEASDDVLLLYTEYTSRSGRDLKEFLNNISSYIEDALHTIDMRPVADDRNNCSSTFEESLKKIKMDSYRAASFSGENHHKFILGHMVVFRMHMNKTEEYLRKCDRAMHGCGSVCEDKPRVRRWKRLALEEISRVKEDFQHTRKAFKDLVLHAKKRLNHLRKLINLRAADSIEVYHKCLDGKFKYD